MLMKRLEAIQRHSAVIAVDETRGPVDVAPYQKVSVTRQACATLGLHCPKDFTWRNGDYVFYLARKQYPEEKFFWMIESDVEHTFSSDEALYQYFDERTNADLLVPYLRVTLTDWWWHQTARPRSTGVQRAMFCFLRLSVRAIDLSLRERRRGRFSLRDRLFWPNDEAFVATEVVAAGLATADLNDFGAPVYTLDTLGYEKPVDGAAGLFRTLCNTIYHPVLYGAAYRARMERIDKAKTTVRRWERLRRRIQKRLR